MNAHSVALLALAAKGIIIKSVVSAAITPAQFQHRIPNAILGLKMSAYVDEVAPNYFPFFICVLLMVICKLLSKIVPFLHENDYAINQVHLQDLDHLLKQIDRNQEQKTK